MHIALCSFSHFLEMNLSIVRGCLLGSINVNIVAVLKAQYSITKIKGVNLYFIQTINRTFTFEMTS